MTREARFVGPLDRLLYLRTLPNIGALPPEELFALAERARERVFPKGSRVLEAGKPISHVYFLVQGRASSRLEGRVIRSYEPPSGVGFISLLAGEPQDTEMVADVDTIALELDAEDLFDAMEENFGFLVGALQQLGLSLADTQRQAELQGVSIRSPAEAGTYPEQELDLIERLIFARGYRGVFATCGIDALVQLVRAWSEERWEPGEVLWRQGDRSDFGLFIVHGIIVCSDDSGQRRFRMGVAAALGQLEMFGQVARSYTAVAETRVVGLRNSNEVFLDVLEDNFALGLAFVRMFASRLARLQQRLAGTSQRESEPSHELAAAAVRS